MKKESRTRSRVASWVRIPDVTAELTTSRSMTMPPEIAQSKKEQDEKINDWLQCTGLCTRPVCPALNAGGVLWFVVRWYRYPAVEDMKGPVENIPKPFIDLCWKGQPHKLDSRSKRKQLLKDKNNMKSKRHTGQATMKVKDVDDQTAMMQLKAAGKNCITTNHSDFIERFQLAGRRTAKNFLCAKISLYPTAMVVQLGWMTFGSYKAFSLSCTYWQIHMKRMPPYPSGIHLQEKIQTDDRRWETSQAEYRIRRAPKAVAEK